MIVAIEGMDGVGKTTVAKSIEKDLNFTYVKDPLKDLFENVIELDYDFYREQKKKIREYSKRISKRRYS